MDVLVIASKPIQTRMLIKCRPIGKVIMADKEGPDNKIIVVPIDNVRHYPLLTLISVKFRNIY